MSTKPKLRTELNLKQGLSPQLQHSVRLMSLTAVELQTEIIAALEDNPFLELPPQLQPWDSQPLTAAKNEGTYGGEGEGSWIDGIDAPETLLDYLRWQCELTPFSPDERVLAEVIIEAINEEGYLSAPLHELLPKDLDDNLYELAHIVLHRIQQFDPAGIGASDLQECLLLQLNQIHPQDKIAKQAIKLVSQNLEQITEYPEVYNLIQNLHPKPGLLYGSTQPEVIIPDLILRQEGNQYQVYLNEAVTHTLQVNQEYARALKQTKASNKPLQEQLNAAKNLIYHLSLRSQTLLSLARCIVKTQEQFFHEGTKALKPLKLEDLSQALDVHPSTVSRLTCNKYIHTPRGLFALKYFLCGALNAEHGVTSTPAVQALITEWIKQEDKLNPLSDEALREKLNERGILIARRTVAKYRETLGIPIKSLRKLKASNQE